MRKKDKTASPPKTLILGAFLPEIKTIRRRFRGNTNVAVATVGIGMVDAMLTTVELLSRLKPQRVIFVGSVGAVDLKTELLSIVTARSAVLKDLGAAMGAAELLAGIDIPIKADRSVIKQITKKPNSPEITAVDAYSTIGITRSPGAAKKMSRGLLNAVESLELYGVAAACKKFRTPWNSIQVVTNHTNSHGYTAWKKHYTKAAHITCEVLLSADW